MVLVEVKFLGVPALLVAQYYEYIPVDDPNFQFYSLVGLGGFTGFCIVLCAMLALKIVWTDSEVKVREDVGGPLGIGILGKRVQKDMTTKQYDLRVLCFMLAEILLFAGLGFGSYFHSGMVMPLILSSLVIVCDTLAHMLLAAHFFGARYARPFRDPDSMVEIFRETMREMKAMKQGGDGAGGRKSKRKTNIARVRAGKSS